VVLQPHEGGRQAAAGEDLDDAAGGRPVGKAQPARVCRRGETVEAVRRQQVQMIGRHPVSGVDRRGRRKQDLLGDPPGRVEHHRCGDRLPPPYVDALAALVEEVQGL